MIIFTVYLFIINTAGLVAMGRDKARSRRGKYRIPERKLFLLAILGASAGIYLGMHCFRHKTRHYKFSAGIPLIIMLQLLLVGYMFQFKLFE